MELSFHEARKDEFYTWENNLESEEDIEETEKDVCIGNITEPEEIILDLI